MSRRLEVIALANFPMVEPGDDLAAQILQSVGDNGFCFEPGDILVLAQKIVSKAENRYAYLNQISPTEAAIVLAEDVEKDSRLIQLILNESVDVLRQRPGVVIVEHRLGYVHANAGIDQSNISSDKENPRVLLLPEDADVSAALLRKAVLEATGVSIGVIINDSAGRAWRNGTVGIAIGTAGFEPLFNQIGEQDLYGNVLEVTEAAVADELAAAASLVMGQAAEACPVVLARGLKLQASEIGSGSLIRDKSQDMFR